MTNFQSFNSLNGWVLPGSGDFFVDENGDLWVPCVCGRGDCEPGESEGEGIPPEEDFEEAGFVTVRIPEEGAALADDDPGGWLYRGRHGGLMRLLIEGCRREDPAAHCCEEACGELECGLCFYNGGARDAVVRLRHQGASLCHSESDMLCDYFDSAPEAPLTVAPGWARWLYLGRTSEDARPQFLRRRRHASRLRHPGEVEALLELAISGHVTILLCACRDFGNVDVKTLALACREEESAVLTAGSPPQ